MIKSFYKKHCLYKNKPYDPKKSCWVPDKATGGFNEGLIESTEGEKVTVSAKGEVRSEEVLTRR